MERALARCELVRMALVEYEVKDRIAYIAFNRPEKRNAINFAMRDEFLECLEKFTDDPDAWVAILYGNGPAFCPGLDREPCLEGPCPPPPVLEGIPRGP